MSYETQTVGTARNERVQLTNAERAAIDALNAASVVGARVPEGYEALAESRRSLAKETREALRSAIPDLEERGRAQVARLKPELEKLKGTAWPAHDVRPEGADRPVADPGFAPLISSLPPLGGVHSPPLHQPSLPPVGGVHVPTLAQVGEFRWVETSKPVVAPANTLNIQLGSSDVNPARIFGHIGWTSDDLFNGMVGFSATFILAPERMPLTDRTFFDVRPELRPGGWVSGWTGLYHPLWAADDKWSKCWRFLDATLNLSSGERLAGASLHENLFFLEDEDPVGQASVNEFFAWVPVLTFTANMADLRQRGISIILRTDFRYDFQLEGESDIWFRNRPGSASESVPAFDNALVYRCWPGFVPA